MDQQASAATRPGQVRETGLGGGQHTCRWCASALMSWGGHERMAISGSRGVASHPRHLHEGLWLLQWS